jgi:hypothetical protein
MVWAAFWAIFSRTHLVTLVCTALTTAFRTESVLTMKADASILDPILPNTIFPILDIFERFSCKYVQNFLQICEKYFY